MVGVGHGALLAAVLACGVAVVASLTGAAREQRHRVDVGARALTAAAVLLILGLAGLGWALLTGDYSPEYVARATSRSMSWPYRLGSLWSGMEGSLLLWSSLLAVGLCAGVVRLRRAAEPALLARVQAVGGALIGAATLLVLTAADPFARLGFPALDGAGLTPILEHPALLYHPPILYLGQTLLAVPFAVTVAALAAGRLDDAWLAISKRFALLAWVALTAGMVAGAHWAYQELGWGGLWAWDPVENASLLPWLATTAFLHSAVVVERRGRLKAWTAALALAAFALALVGAYLTRSGATASVHAFAEARAIGVAFLAAVTAVVVGGGLLLVKRGRNLGPGWRTNGVASREAALLANNVILLAVLVVVTAGTLAPLISKAVGAVDFTVAPRFFAMFTAIPALVALALAGIGPLLPWTARSPGRGSSPVSAEHPESRDFRRRRATAAVGAGLGAAVAAALGLLTPLVITAAVTAGVTFALSATQALRVRRRSRALAACLAHLGLALALFGIAGSTAGTETSGPLRTGEQLTLGRYRLVQEGLIERSSERRSSVRVQLGLFAGGRRLGTLRPGLDTFHGPGGSGAPLPETALRSTPREDLLVTVVRIDLDRGVAVVEVFRRPLVLWVWIGGILVVAGGALALQRSGRDRSRSGTASGSRKDGASAEPERVPTNHLAEIAHGSTESAPCGGSAEPPRYGVSRAGSRRRPAL
ncbi:MAG TPA: cytochrome c-type biogenesis CcmF C-terminal domain-containing protein [Acidimicrobiia bacterium]|jgi:cytochrome c-type biogenesis protein CcmF|nr:cytochrome c-type biogenesis CcmF C-terminal domain-containing protein [Acidimicrobiia bacterium]